MKRKLLRWVLKLSGDSWQSALGNVYVPVLHRICTYLVSNLLVRWELVQGRLQQVWRQDHFGFGTASGPCCKLIVVGVNPAAASDAVKRL